MSAPDVKEAGSPQLESVDEANAIIQGGVSDAEALMSAWTKKSLIAAYVSYVNYTQPALSHSFCLTVVVFS